MAIGYVNEYDPWAVRCFPEPLVKRPGVRIILSDGLTLTIGCLKNYIWSTRYAGSMYAAVLDALHISLEKRYPMTSAGLNQNYAG